MKMPVQNLKFQLINITKILKRKMQNNRKKLVNLKLLMEKGSSKMSNWYLQNGKDSDVVISTRVRLARNIKNFNFENKCSKDDKKHILEKIEGVLPSIGYDLKLLRLKDMDNLTKQSLVEKHIISPEFASSDDENCAILINDEENICIMINEEDHLRMQLFGEGIAIEELMNLAIEIDQKLERLVDYAFSEKYGYLTACPTNVGTGLRVSVMVHLPGLAETGNLNKILHIVNNFGMSVRGVYGEGSQSMGNMYQISNNQTLGLTEQEIVKNMKLITDKIIEQERVARKYLGKNQIGLADKVYRAFGILENARILSSNECIDLLSDVKLGTDMGIISELDDTKIKKLFLYTKPANLQKYYGKVMDSNERDLKRTDVIRKIVTE